eukprot:2669911-Rhodomonas_salina.1
MKVAYAPTVVLVLKISMLLSVAYSCPGTGSPYAPMHGSTRLLYPLKRLRVARSNASTNARVRCYQGQAEYEVRTSALLRAPYAESGTEAAYGATRYAGSWYTGVREYRSGRACRYVLPYQSTRFPGAVQAQCGTEVVYAASNAVLSQGTECGM